MEIEMNPNNNRITHIVLEDGHSWRAWLTIALAACAWLTYTIYSAASAEQEFRWSEAGRGGR